MAKLQKEIKNHIKELTKGLYDGYYLELDKLCEKLQLKCYLADFGTDKISGALIRDENGETYSVYVNRKHSKNRQRFTIAHECGHYISYLNDSYSAEPLKRTGKFEDRVVTRKGSPAVFRAEGVTSDAETEANQIAAELLMPMKEVEELIDDDVSIERMAEYFGVSESAMSIRLKALGYRIIY